MVKLGSAGRVNKVNGCEKPCYCHKAFEDASMKLLGTQQPEKDQQFVLFPSASLPWKQKLPTVTIYTMTIPVVVG